MTLYMLVASISYVLMIMGLFYRQKKQIHFRLMGLSIFLDLSVVLILEFTRNAVATAVEMKLPPLQQAHIFVSTIAVLLYFPVISLGILRIKGNRSPKIWSAHKKLGITAFIFRSLGFLLMFSMLK